MFRLKSIVLLTVFALFAINFTVAGTTPLQQPVVPSPSWNVDLGIELPIGKTPWEMEMEKLFPTVFAYNTDDPPPQPATNPAEWEQMTGVLIRYPLGISYSLIAEMSENVEVVTIVSSTSQQNTCSNNYQQNGVNMANTDWLIAPSNSIYTRDYGPWFIFQGQDVQGISDHNYNRPWRPDDNLIPLRFGEAYGIPVYDLPLTHTGGNYMSDGMGISMSTNLVYNENPTLPPSTVDEYMHTWLGVEDYDVMQDILTSGIHHIDCWAKLLDPGRILAKRLTPTNAQLEANVAYWQNKISSYGRPYEVIRVDCASSTPYTNSLILDNKVLVPLFNNALDQQAMQVYQQAMPGYEVLGFTGSWVSDDALHCRTMGITDRYMLRILHIPLFDQVNTGQGYEVEATIHPYSNQPLSLGMPLVYWRLQGGTWASVPMTNQGGDEYLGIIPPQADYASIEYYIHAEDLSGRSENHPFIGAPNAHKFHTLPAAVPLQVTLTPAGLPIVIPPTGGSFNFSLQIANTGIIPIDFDCWLSIVLPSGNIYLVTLRTGIRLMPGVSILRNMTQVIPAGAPAGNYEYQLTAGFYPSVILDQDTFPFTKSAAEGIGGAVFDRWCLYGWDEPAPAVIAALPKDFTLKQNYPNPFNPKTTIEFSLPFASEAALTVYNISGQEVVKLVEGSLSAGEHKVEWNASGYPSGLYICRLQTPEFDQTIKMMLVK